MLKSLNNFSLMDLLPDSLTRDPIIRACIEGLDEELRKLTVDISETLILSRIDEVSEDIVDLLAWQFDVPFYQPAELDLQTKKALVKNAIADHRIRGTPVAVEKLLTDVFNGAVVKEWWEFGGAPYTFRIEQLGRSLATESDFKDFELALNVAKNVRSHLESFTMKLEQLMEVFVGIVNHHLEIKNDKYRFHFKPFLAKNYIGIAKSINEMQFWRHNLKFKPEHLNLNAHLYQSNFECIFATLRKSDLPVHDLRSTAILDLLILGLGIPRECGIKRAPIWIFEDYPAISEYMGILFEQSAIQTAYSRKIKINHISKNSLGIFNSTLELKNDNRKLKIDQKLRLGAYILAATSILYHILHFKEVPQSAAKIAINSNMELFIQASLMHFEERRSIQKASLFSNIVNKMGFLIATSISQSLRSKDKPSKESITLYLPQSLNLITYFSRYRAENRNDRLNLNQNLKLNLQTLNKLSKAERRAHLYKLRDQFSETKVKIGAISFTNAIQSLKTNQISTIKNHDLSLNSYIGVEHFTFIQHNIPLKSQSIENSIPIKAYLNSFTSINHEFKSPIHSKDTTLFFDNQFALNTAISHFSLVFQKFQLNSDIELTSRIYYNIMNTRTSIIHFTSRDSPSHTSHFIEKNDKIEVYSGILSWQFENHRDKIQAIKQMKSKIVTSNFLSILGIKKEFSLNRQETAKIEIKVGFKSFKSIITHILSDFRISDIPIPSMNLPIYQGFIFNVNERR